MFISPSVSPMRGTDKEGDPGPPNNPAIRKYLYGRYTFELQGYEQYYLYLKGANSQNNTDWQILYDFTRDYQLPNISPPNLDQLLRSFKPFASEAFHRYYERKFVHITEGYVPCGCECKLEEICAIANLNRSSYNECMETSECGSFSSATTFSNFPQLTFASFVATCLMLQSCFAI